MTASAISGTFEGNAKIKLTGRPLPEALKIPGAVGWLMQASTGLSRSRRLDAESLVLCSLLHLAPSWSLRPLWSLGPTAFMEQSSAVTLLRSGNCCPEKTSNAPGTAFALSHPDGIESKGSTALVHRHNSRLYARAAARTRQGSPQLVPDHKRIILDLTDLSPVLTSMRALGTPPAACPMSPQNLRAPASSAINLGEQSPRAPR